MSSFSSQLGKSLFHADGQFTLHRVRATAILCPQIIDVAVDQISESTAGDGSGLFPLDTPLFFLQPSFQMGMLLVERGELLRLLAAVRQRETDNARAIVGADLQREWTAFKSVNVIRLDLAGAPTPELQASHAAIAQRLGQFALEAAIEDR